MTTQDFQDIAEVVKANKWAFRQSGLDILATKFAIINPRFDAKHWLDRVENEIGQSARSEKAALTRCPSFMKSYLLMTRINGRVKTRATWGVTLQNAKAIAAGYWGVSVRSVKAVRQE